MSDSRSMGHRKWRSVLDRLSLVCAALVLSMVVGCGQAGEPADSSIESSFQVFPPAGKADTIGLNEYNVSIALSAMGKEFLLQASLVEQSGASMFSGIQSRIVTFEQDGQTLRMFEAPADYAAGKPYTPQHLLLASFPIGQLTPTHALFDFNAGMTQLYVASDWYASDFERNQDPRRLKSLPVETSYIQAASLSSQKNQLEIRQVAKLGAEYNNAALIMVYYLSPYLPDPTFVPLQSPSDYNSVGFFQVAPKMIPGSMVPVIRASRFHQSKPIVFAISSNTPTEMKQAVRDGVLYWNKVLGTDRVEVIDAPPGVAAPSMEYNVVQWVDSPGLGFAYADAQMDPRTGEILHGQVFLSSSWAIYGLSQARQAFRRLIVGQSPEDRSPALSGSRLAGLGPRLLVSLSGFESDHLHVDGERKLFNLLEHVVLNTPADDRILEAAQLTLTEVVAHEVGHVLGLRHNFAASLGANISPAGAAGFLNQLLLGLNPSVPPGTEPATSVMDYLDSTTTIMLGKMIANGHPGLSYDVKAIEVLYGGAAVDPTQIPLFCTDSHKITFPDCAPYDAGSSALQHSRTFVQNELETVPSYFFERYIAAKAPLPGNPPLPVEKVVFSPASWAAYAIRPLNTAFGLLTTDGMTVAVRRTFPVVSALNLDEVDAAERVALAADLTRLGGLPAVFTVGAEGVALKGYQKLEKVVDANTSATTAIGQQVTFSPEEQALIKANGKIFFQKYEEELLLAEMRMLSNVTDPAASGAARLAKIANAPFADELLQHVVARVKQVLFAESGATIKGTIELTVTKPDKSTEVLNLSVTLPVYAHAHRVRLAAARVLASLKGEYQYWGRVERTALKKAYTDAMNGLVPEGTIKELASLPQELATWFARRDEIAGAL